MRVFRAIVGAILVSAAPAAVLAQTVCTLSAEVEAPTETAPGAQLAFLVRIDCAPGIPPEEEGADQQPGKLDFAATPGEQLIIGASLTDEAPSNWDYPEDPKPDVDFPIRYVTIPDQAGGESWQFTTPADPALTYGHLIMRVWNPTALAECTTGRDGCEKFGYVLIWEELRTESALELPLAAMP